MISRHDDDDELLRHAFRDVKPLKGRTIGQRNKRADVDAAHPASRRAATKPRASTAAPNPTVAKPKLPDLAAGAAVDVDLRTVQKLKRGRIAVSARLDLHGHTQDEAYGALAHFLAAMQGPSSRAVLVITGKSGVLRREVPRWLNALANRARILSFAQARIADGGEGALYVLLRKVTR
jgi:DNA-nicking Smr family endonuclease